MAAGSTREIMPFSTTLLYLSQLTPKHCPEAARLVESRGFESTAESEEKLLLSM